MPFRQYLYPMQLDRKLLLTFAFALPIVAFVLMFWQSLDWGNTLVNHVFGSCNSYGTEMMIYSAASCASRPGLSLSVSSGISLLPAFTCTCIFIAAEMHVFRAVMIRHGNYQDYRCERLLRVESVVEMVLEICWTAAAIAASVILIILVVYF